MFSLGALIVFVINLAREMKVWKKRDDELREKLEVVVNEIRNNVFHLKKKLKL